MANLDLSLLTNDDSRHVRLSAEDRLINLFYLVVVGPPLFLKGLIRPHAQSRLFLVLSRSSIEISLSLSFEFTVDPSMYQVVAVQSSLVVDIDSSEFATHDLELRFQSPTLPSLCK